MRLHLRTEDPCLPGCLLKLETASLCKEMLRVDEAEVWLLVIFIFVSRSQRFSPAPFSSLANGRIVPQPGCPVELRNKLISSSFLKPWTLCWFYHLLLKLSRATRKGHWQAQWSLCSHRGWTTNAWASPGNSEKRNYTVVQHGSLPLLSDQRYGKGPFPLGTCSPASPCSIWRLLWELGWPGEQLLLGAFMQKQWLYLWELKETA